MRTTDERAREAERLTSAYARRDALGLDDRYSLTRPENLHLHQHRERALLRLMRKTRMLPLAGKRILDLGCGNGNLMRDLVRYGASPHDIVGVDMLPARLASGTLLGGGSFALADGSALPLRPGTFDAAFAFTVFSSILDARVRAGVAAQVAGALRPGGVLYIYDFVWNPLNRDVRGIGPGELRRLFPNCGIRSVRLTLAPPITRRLVRLSWSLCSALERIPPLCSHTLTAITVRDERAAPKT